MPRPLSAMRTRTRRSPLGAQLHFDVGLLGRVLDRVVDQVAEDNVQVHVPRPHGAKLQVELDRGDRHAIAEADGPRTVLQQRPEQNVFDVGVGAAGIEAARVQQLGDEAVQPVEVFQHELIEARLLLLRHLAAVERLQVELHRGDGGFQFVGDAVDEVGLPPAEIDRLDREDQVDDHAGQQHPDERGPQREQDPIQGSQPTAPQRPEHAQQYPADGQHHQQGDHDDGQQDGQTQGAARQHGRRGLDTSRGRRTPWGQLPGCVGTLGA